MKILKHFDILKDGEEEVAEILGAFVYKENVYLSVGIDGEILLYQIMPHGLKEAPKPVSKKFQDYVREQDAIRARCSDKSK